MTTSRKYAGWPVQDIAAGARPFDEFARLFSASKSLWSGAALLAWCALAMVLFTYDLGWRELWLDEVITLRATKLSVPELVGSRYAAGHTPLYFLIVKLWMQLPGAPTAPWAVDSYMRLPSAFFATAAGALLIHVLLHLRQRMAAFALGIMWLSWPMLLYYSGEARPYSLVLFFTALGIWGVLMVVSRAKNAGSDGTAPGKKLLYASAVGSIGAALTMPLGIVVGLAVELGALFAFGIKQRPDYWSRRCRIVWPSLLGVAAIFLPAVLRRSNKYWTDKYSHTQFNFENVVGILSEIYTPNRAILYLLPLLAVLLYGLALERKRSLQKIDGAIWIFLSFGAVFIPAFLIVISMKSSLMVGRYFMPALCFTLPLLALFMASLQTIVGRLLAGAAVATAIVAGFQAQVPEPKMYSELKAILAKHNPRQVAFYATHVRYPPVLEFYFQEFDAKIYFRDKRPDTSSLFWVVQAKEEFEKQPGVSWVDGRLQCSYRLSKSEVVTVVAPDAERLKSFEGCTPGAG